MVQTQTNKQTKIKQNITKTPEKKNQKKKKERKRNVHTDGIPKDSWDSLQLRSPGVYPKRSSLVKWQSWTYISPYIHPQKLTQSKENIQTKKIHPRSINIFQHLSWLRYDSKLFINIKHAWWKMSLMQAKWTLNMNAKYERLKIDMIK